jgi:hypothetical protein
MRSFTRGKIFEAEIWSVVDGRSAAVMHKSSIFEVGLSVAASAERGRRAWLSGVSEGP